MRLLYPELLWLLLLLPLIAILRSRHHRAPAVIFSSTAVAATLAEARRTGPGSLRTLIQLLIFTLLILAMARPQWGRSITEVEASGIDIMLAVDVSGSMRAMDFSLGGQPVNRLKAVQSVVEQFVTARPNDRIGLLAFSNKPFIISPLTLDHYWLKKRLKDLTIGMIDEDGTAIGSAIGVSIQRLHSQASKSRLMILLTDGMNNSGKVPPLVAAEAAAALGIKVYTIGVGTRGKAPIPVRDRFGRQRIVQRSVNIDEQTLIAVASQTGSRYFRATDTDSLGEIYKEIDTMETTVRTLKRFDTYRDLFPLCIGLALMLQAGGLLLQKTRIP